MKRMLAIATALAVSVFGMVGIGSTQAAAATCKAETVIAIGGSGDGDSSTFAGKADVLVQYSGLLNDVEGGIRELDKAVAAVRHECPATTIGFTGFSQGGVIIHVYLQRKGPIFADNAWYVAFSDSKQDHTGQSSALFLVVGPPTAGVDADFGGVPGVSICYVDDVICNKHAKSGWFGYTFLGTHTEHYDFDARLHKHQRGILWV